MPFEACQHVGGLWSEGVGCIQCVKTGFGVTQGREGLPKLVVTFWQLRPLAQQATKAGHGSLHSAQFHQGAAQLQQQIRTLWRGTQDHP